MPLILKIIAYWSVVAIVAAIALGFVNKFNKPSKFEK